MPPKRKPTLATSPATPSNAQLAQQRKALLKNGTVTMLDSSPLPPRKMRLQETSPIEASPIKNEVPSPAPDTAGIGSAEKQGVAELVPVPAKKAPGRKRKAASAVSGDDGGAEPAAKRKRTTTAAAAPRKAPAKKRAVKTPKIVVDEVDSEKEEASKEVEHSRQPLKPLAGAVKCKLRAVEAFLDAHTSPLIEREAGSNIATVYELDLLAALIILRIDYQLDASWDEVCLEDASDMVVARLDAGKVSVDFDKTCQTERAAQAKLARRGTGLEDVNLIEVEIELLAAKRKQLVEDQEPGAGYRVYDEQGEDAESGELPSSG